MLRSRTILQQNGKKVFYGGLPIVRRLLANRTDKNGHYDNYSDSNSSEKQVFYNGLPIYGRRRHLVNRTDWNSDNHNDSQSDCQSKNHIGRDKPLSLGASFLLGFVPAGIANGMFYNLFVTMFDL
jgi:hypothetical protein